MKTTWMLVALLSTCALAMPLASATLTDPLSDGLPAGATTSPICVWWHTTGWYVYTPGATVNAGPAHATLDPVYVIYVPPTHGNVCVGDYFDLLQVNKDFSSKDAQLLA